MAECKTGVLVELCDDEPEQSERLYFDDELRQKIVCGNWWDLEDECQRETSGNKEAILVDISDELQSASIRDDLGSDPYHTDLDLSRLDTESLLEDEVFDFDCAKSLSDNEDGDGSHQIGNDNEDREKCRRSTFITVDGNPNARGSEGHKDKMQESTNKSDTACIQDGQLGPKEMAELFKEATILAMKFTTIGQKRRSLQLQAIEEASATPNRASSDPRNEKMEVDEFLASFAKPEAERKSEAVACEEYKENNPEEAAKGKGMKKGGTLIVRKDTFKVEHSKMRLSLLAAVGPKPMKVAHGPSLAKDTSAKPMPAIPSTRKSLQTIKDQVPRGSSLKRSNSQSSNNPRASTTVTSKGPPAPSRIPTSPLCVSRRQRSNSGSSVSSLNSSCSTDVSSKEATSSGTDSVSTKRILSCIVPKTLQQSLVLNKKKMGVTSKAVPMKATLAMRPLASPTTPSKAFKKSIVSGLGSSSSTRSTPNSAMTPTSNTKRFSFGAGTPTSKIKTTASKLK